MGLSDRPADRPPGPPLAAKDLYTFIGRNSCNKSVNVSNIETALWKIEPRSVTSLNVYEIDVNQFFAA